MSITGYLSAHWGLIVLLLGLTTILLSDTHLDRVILRRMGATTGMLFVYSITCYVETFLGDQVTFSPLRPFLSAFNYSLIAFILVNIILVMYPTRNLLFWMPAVINCVLCFVSIKTRIVFYFSKDNHFGRRFLGYLTYFVCVVYLIYFIYLVFRNAKSRLEDYTLPIFMACISLLCLVMPLLFEDMALHWFSVTIAIDIVLYYIYILQQFTKRDTLTRLLNRQSYYRDAEKYLGSITALVAMDMNGLKEVNDNEGHLAGDLALKTLANCFWHAAHHNHRVYRIGGDEYAILCNSASEEDVQELIRRIRESMGKTPYSCSIGYAMKREGSTLDTMYLEADDRMYDEKMQYYEATGKERRKR